MKLLSLSTSDLTGGAAVAASRLHLGLREAEVDSTLMVADKRSSDPHTIAIHNGLTCSLRRNFERLPLSLEKTPDSIAHRSLAWLPNRQLAAAIAEHQPDLIHLHWTQNGFLPLSQLRKLKVPLVWTFHDLWPVCGSFHHEYKNDLRFPESYNASNRPASRKGLDLDKWVAKRKATLYKNLSIQAIVTSRWMAKQVGKAQLWADRPLHVVPIGLDSKVFKPLDRSAARHLWNLPQDKKIVLYGAMYAETDPNKGLLQIQEALQQLALPKEEVHLVVFGMSQPAEGTFPLETHAVGILQDQVSLAALYSAADVMVMPSLQESFGQTASEALACGTPVVAFDTSGLRDIVDHQKNGYLADAFDTADMARGIEYVLTAGQEHYRSLATAGRDKVLNLFDTPRVVQKHLEIYQTLLAEKKGPLRQGDGNNSPPKT